MPAATAASRRLRLCAAALSGAPPTLGAAENRGADPPAAGRPKAAAAAAAAADAPARAGLGGGEPRVRVTLLSSPRSRTLAPS